MPISLRLLIPFHSMISIHLGNGLQREDPPRPKKSINHCSSAKGALLFEEDSGYLLREITFCDRNFLENLVSIQICRLPGIMLLHREGQSQ
jgi:hypothetical protein